MVSANPVVGVDLIPHKLEMAKKFGLTHGLIGGRDELDLGIRNIIGTRGADAVIETTGNPRLIEQAYELSHPDSVTVCV
jgi:threonine dehydrogenase-like Zn-dependent dehydrogenase